LFSSFISHGAMTAEFAFGCEAQKSLKTDQWRNHKG